MGATNPTRAATAERIIAALVPFMETHAAHDISPYLAGTGARRATICGLEIMYLAKAGRLTKTPPPRLLDIWLDGGKKVFSAWFAPTDIVRLDRGAWVNELLAFLETRAPA